MQCSGCGQGNADGARFCVRCGLAFAPAVSAIPFQPPPPLKSASTPPDPNITPPAGGATPDTRRGNRSGRKRSPAYPVICRLCGAQVMSNRFACPDCNALLSMIANPNDPTGTTYLPVRMSYPPPTDAIEPGVRGRTLHLPHAIAIRRWHWGAFGLTTFWLFAHRFFGWGLISLLLNLLTVMALFNTGFHSGPYPVILVYPGSALLLSTLLGLHGYSLTWETSRAATPEEAIQKERNWQRAGVFCAILKILGFIAFAILVLAPK